jgi:hypothetical protein
MLHSIIAGALLIAALALCLLAQRQAWAPSLRRALAVGVGLRVAVWFLAATDQWQPYDFISDFSAAATAALHHHDPMLTGRDRGWPFLPTMAFVLAGELKLGQWTHLAWQVVGRLVPVAADVLLIPLVGRLAGQRGPLRRFQYACNPVVIMVCAIHGQLEPEVLVLGVAALVAARSRRDVAAGPLLGLSVAIGSWSLLLAPGVLMALSQWRHRLRAALLAAAVPVAVLATSPLTVGTPVHQFPDVVHGLVNLRPVVGQWGWTAILTGGRTELLPGIGAAGTVLLAVALLLAGYLWRRADPVDLTIALLIAFLLVSPRVGAQYLTWPLPFLTARPTRYTMAAVCAAALWAGFGYLYFGPHLTASWLPDSTFGLSSWAVLPLLAAAMPWGRRYGPAHSVPEPTGEQEVADFVSAG